MTPSPATSSTTASDSVPVEKLDRKHNFWSNNHEWWDLYDLLYRGGKDIVANAARFLQKRPKELPEVYQSRLAKFEYQNILGTALGWYQSALFRKDPSIDLKLVGNDDPAALADTRKTKYTDFLQNCDRNHTTYVDLWRQIFLNLVVFKGCYACVDLPRLEYKPKTLAEQKQAGGLSPYVMLYDPRHVINWAVNEFGELDWILIKIQTSSQEFLGPGKLIDRWTYYDRTEYRVYEREKKTDASTGAPIILDPTGTLMSSTANANAKLVDRGPHALSGANRVPVRYFSIADGLWMANKVYLPAVAHLNMENSYLWALFMANLPIPIIKSDTELTQTVSETAVIHLDEKGTFEWSEPKGTSFEQSAKCLAGLREEIYRTMYLMAQGRSSSASASASSGYSKELDMQPSKDVLASYGDGIRAGMQNLLGDVALVNDEADIEFDVRGFNFEISPALQEAETLEIMMSLDLPSNTLYKEAQKRVAHAYLTDANRAIVQTVDDEIENAPTRSEQQAAQMQAQKLSMDRSLNRAVSGLTQQAQNAA